MIHNSIKHPNIVLYCGDSIFSYLMSHKILDEISPAVLILSSRNRKSISQIYSIYKKTSIDYFLYRSTVQIISLISGYFGHSVRAKLSKSTRTVLAKNSTDVKSVEVPKRYLGIALNFDIIIPKEVILAAKNGIVNVHASDLPRDKGISPVVWAFCRGDDFITISYYKMDGGIDTGELLRKDKIRIEKNWSLFRTYCEVCVLSAARLPELSKSFRSDLIASKLPSQLDEAEAGSYNSWPSKELSKMSRRLGRKYINIDDIIYLVSTLRAISSNQRC